MNHWVIPEFLGTLPNWITATGVLTLLSLLLRYHMGLKRLAIEASKVLNSDEADIRDHYAEEVAALRRRLDEQSERHRAILAASDEKHEICQRDREKLRDDARTLKDIVAGLIRIITQASASQAILLTPAASAEVEAAAKRVQMLFAPTIRDEEPRHEPS